jgi:hypothetical protein
MIRTHALLIKKAARDAIVMTDPYRQTEESADMQTIARGEHRHLDEERGFPKDSAHPRGTITIAIIMAHHQVAWRSAWLQNCPMGRDTFQRMI